jgi:hypothetical protein
VTAVQPETATPYVAPARYVLTVLHRKGDAPGQVTELAAAEPVDGWTACGKPMLQSELWRPADGRDGDSLCTGCMPRGTGCAVAADEPEATLW